MLHYVFINIKQAGLTAPQPEKSAVLLWSEASPWMGMQTVGGCHGCIAFAFDLVV